MPRLTDRTAWILWGVLFAIMCGLILAGNRKTVTHNYFLAADRWQAGQELYESGGEGFLYFPQSAVLCVPLLPLSPVGREIVWRIFTIGVFAAGVYRIAKFAETSYGKSFFLPMTLVAIPLAWSSARNGQATLGIAGLTMLAAADLAEQRWWRATAWLTFGIAVKPLMIVPALLTFIHRPMIGRVVIGTAICFAVPYAFQSTEYVNSQMIACVQMLKTANRVGDEGYWAQLYGLLRAFGYEVSPETQTAGRLLAAFATLIACYVAARRTTPQQAAIFTYTFAASYLMLFNPRTENNTYSFIGPAIGLFWTHACLVRKDWLSGGVLMTVALGTVGSFEIGRHFAATKQEAIWLAPAMCVVFTIYAAWMLRKMVGESSPEMSRSSATSLPLVVHRSA